MNAEPTSDSPQLIAVIVDDLRVTTWQANALARLADRASFFLLSCRNTRTNRRPGKHALYYALNLLSLKTPRTRMGAIPGEVPVAGAFEFEAENDGNWQKLPPTAIDALKRLKPSAIVKFGMGLLRVPPDLPCPILSFHHGDPRQFRGRPAGFYEMLSGQGRLGQIVQILSNSLDAGKVVAFAETRILPYSYRATMDEAYRCSPLLLPEALRNALSGSALPLEPSGRNYRLPSNSTVFLFVVKMIAAWVRRLGYGMFFEKNWQVALSPGGNRDPAVLVGGFPDSSSWQRVPCPPAYRFIADPFPDPSGDGVLAEGLRRSDWQGEIVRLASGPPLVLCSGRGHFSYPATIRDEGGHYLVPEVSEWSSQRLFRLGAGSAEEVRPLEVEGSPQLVDPTPYRARDGKIYLFANDAGERLHALRLWVAPDLFSPFSEHPRSPIHISPAGARMGGALVEANGRLYRFGQDGTRDYGDGLYLFEILELSDTEFREREVGRVTLSTKGPHTLNIHGDRLLFDFYEDQFSFAAGLRRLQARTAKRRAKRLV